MRKSGVLVVVALACVLALPAVSAADPTTQVLPVELTCGTQTFNLVVPAGGQASAGLFVNSRSVAVLMGVNGEFVPGFNEENTTTCTATFPNGESLTANVIFTPRR
jgi:hypothetical protein